MAIRKGSFTFEFLFDDATDSMERVKNMDIKDIIEECDDGTMIGHVPVPRTFTVVDAVDVSEQLRLMGNDGTFFNE